MQNTTEKFRFVFVTLFVIAVLSALVGWAYFDRDPNQLTSLLGLLSVTIGIGEASNVGKRATFKPEA